ncbi:MAG: ribonuclease HII [Abditibacteriaceae bacterium]
MQQSKSTFIGAICEYEKRLQAQGYVRIAGVDEAGRGPLAGPVVAAAVLLRNHQDSWIRQLNDSKKLSETQREKLFGQITDQSQFGIGIVDHITIDKINIRQATWQAMQLAVENLSHKHDEIDYVLIDGLPYGAAAWPYEAIVKGDAKVRTIAAASIVAKVTRDHIMRDLDKQFPQYGFAKHKGYGTRRHLEALQLHGSCDIHRKTFAPVKLHSVN